MKWEYWVHIPSWDMAICAPPKCASRSVLITVASSFYPDVSYDPIDLAEHKQLTEFYTYTDYRYVDNKWRKLAIIRDPVERFLSLWEHNCRDNFPGVSEQPSDSITMYKLIRMIRNSLKSNAHWAPQSSIIGHQENITFCKLSNLNAVWPLFVNVDLQHRNKTCKQGVSVPEDIVEEIRCLYKCDYELLEWAI